MRIFIVIIVSFIYIIKANCQIDSSSIKILNQLLLDTYNIMKEKKIGIRVNLKMDSPISIEKDAKEIALNARFNLSDTPNLMYNGNHIESFYKNPRIHVSPLLYDILFSKKDTSILVSLKAASIIVHEMVHYFQSTDDFNTYKSFSKANQTELEADAVMAIYFLRRYNPLKFEPLIQITGSSVQDYKKLFNAYYKEVYPWRDPPF